MTKKDKDANKKTKEGTKYLILRAKGDYIKTVNEPIRLDKYVFGSPEFVKIMSKQYKESFKDNYKFYVSSKKIKGKALVYYACDNMYNKKENKHELLHPVDTKLFFGNVFVFLCDTKGGKLRMIDLTKNKYDYFNELAIEGTIDLGSSDSDDSDGSDGSDDSSGSLKDFIVSDNETIETYSDEMSCEEEIDL